MTASKITALRKAAGLTQDELADKAGVTVRTIQRIEASDTVPRAYTLRKIAEALGVDPQEFAPDEATTTTHAEPGTDNLQWLNLSCFTYLFIPFVHVLVPYQFWKKNKTAAGKKIITTQITWTIILHGSLILALAFNLVMFHFFQKTTIINYLWLALFMYAVNAAVIVRTHVRLKSGKCRV